MNLALLTPLAGSFLLCCMTSANATSEGIPTHVFNVDNDSFMKKKQDNLYTSGIRYARQYTQSDATQSSTDGWRIGQDMCTASSTQRKSKMIRALDRPYAAWLYGGVYRESYQADGSHLRTGLDFGCLGPCAGGELLQDTYHKIVGKKSPNGWSKQVRNEIGLVLYGDVASQRWTLSPWLDLKPSLQGRFGNIHTDTSGVAVLRFGNLNALPDQPTQHVYLRGKCVA